MAVTVKDANDQDVAIKSTPDGGEERYHHIVDESALPDGAATETTLATLATETTLAAVETALGTLTTPADTQPVSGAKEWTALGTTTTVINGADVAPTLKGLANNANKLGTEFDNSDAAARAYYADMELLCRGASAFTAGTSVKVWLIESLDGTNYEDGDDSVTPARPPDGYFFLRAVATAQRIALRGMVLPPTKFKPLIRNEGGQAFTGTDAENVLRIRTYGEALT